MPRRHVMKQPRWSGISDMEHAGERSLPSKLVPHTTSRPLPPDGILEPNLLLWGTLDIGETRERVTTAPHQDFPPV
ncbi:hypothetical protein E2C01_015504 [Portunus trituberculatus]|uniref:Uncharacterized protein n=1 Tax=Portunus trituberculatus TaxID=210409 RepID=A0A5B7DN38_PORTR|nr:hypothetical protein [Portunus trituberculatus]